MKPENHPERQRRQRQFGVAYLLLLLLLAGCGWVSFRVIPALSEAQFSQSARQLASFRQQLTRTDGHLAVLKQGGIIDEPWLRTFFGQADALDQQYSSPSFQQTTRSYRRLVAEYEDGRQNGDPELQQLSAQRTDLETRQLALQRTVSGIDRDMASMNRGNPPPPPVPPVSAKAPNLHPTIFTGHYGPFRPLLVRGSGEFGANAPQVNASAQVIVVDETHIVLSLYFELNDNSTFAKTTERYELYTAPTGLRITAVSVPQNTPWRINYTDRTPQEDQFSIADGLFTLAIQASTPGLDVGGPGGSSLTVRLNRPIRIDLTR